MEETGDLVEALLESLRLKEVRRAGWGRVPHSPGESVAEHSWGVALLALLLSWRFAGIDRERLLALALLHDLAEVRTGDITPNDGIPREEKKRREFRALREILSPLGEVGRDLLDLVELPSPERDLVRELDALELLFECTRAERAGARREDLDPFRRSARSKISHPLLLEIANHLERRGRAKG